MRKPFWRKNRKCWYVKDETGKDIRLGPDKEEAMRLWHSLFEPRNRADDPSIGFVAERFLSEHASGSQRVFADAKRILQALIDRFDSNSLVSSLTPGKITAWIKEPNIQTKAGKRAWSLYRQRDVGRMVRAIFQWAEDSELIRKNPLKKLRLETPEPRNAVVPPGVHRQLVEACLASRQSRSFALYLIASHCGARPQQIREVTAANVSHDFRTVVFPRHKSRRKTGKPLVVFASPCLQTILRILVAARPVGELFRNDRGEAWKKDTVSHRIRRLRESLGLDPKIIAYAYRHTFATDALRAGVDLATVAVLLGHNSTEMVSRVYGHLAEHPDHIAKAAVKVAAKRIGGT
jgi:integrase